MINRDYNLEIQDTKDHKYAYNFDLDIMHYYMIKTFEVFFESGNILELGSFKGDFTRRLLNYFNNVTCVEASEEAIDLAKNNLTSTGKINFIHSTFETLKLDTVYDNIIMTHVLEHIENPIAILTKINEEWLSEKGKVFLVCPNAVAASRQIAVNMGLLSYNEVITPDEKLQGHKRTYTFEILENDIILSGLKIIHKRGIFFKALANYQWDTLLQTDIVSKDYLDGCYRLGHKYPELCSSIFFLCEKN